MIILSAHWNIQISYYISHFIRSIYYNMKVYWEFIILGLIRYFISFHKKVGNLQKEFESRLENSLRAIIKTTLIFSALFIYLKGAICLNVCVRKKHIFVPSYIFIRVSITMNVFAGLVMMVMRWSLWNQNMWEIKLRPLHLIHIIKESCFKINAEPPRYLFYDYYNVSNIIQHWRYNTIALQGVLVLSSYDKLFI